jgi:heme-degrading monooxygenase HmoA
MLSCTGPIPYFLFPIPILILSLTMLTRVVKMYFSADFIADFKILFTSTQPFIADFEGCNGVKLLQDQADPQIFFTISEWQSALHLENYRNSELFIQTWSKVKPHFLSKAEAWSLGDVY